MYEVNDLKMKSKIILSFFVLSILVLNQNANGQNWECIKTDGEYLFGQGEKVNSTILIDSTYTIDGIIHYRNIRGVRQVSAYCVSPDEPLLIGEDAYSDSAGNYYFNTIADIQVMIKSRAALGQSWILFQNNSGSLVFEAQVDSVIAGNVLGLSDSVKVISIQAYNGSGQPIDNGYNNIRIRLSKSYGLTSILDFYAFPAYNWYWTLRGMSNPAVGVQTFGFPEIYDMEIGDEFHVSTLKIDYASSIEKEIIKILARKTIDSAGMLVLTFHNSTRTCYHDDATGQTTCYSGYSISSQTVDLNSSFALEMGKLPGQAYYPHSSNYSMGQSEIILEGGLLYQTKYDGHPEYFMGTPTCYSEDNSGPAINYVKGCGGPFENYYDYHNSYFEELVYYQKGDKKWGTPFHLNIDDSYWCFRTNYYSPSFYSRKSERAVFESDQGIDLHGTKSGNKTYLTNYNTVRNIGDSCYIGNGFAWTGKQMIRDNAGNYEFINASGDTMRICPYQQVGETLPFYKNISKGLVIKSTVAEITQQPVFGVVDNVKKITFRAYDLNGDSVNHQVNDEYLLLSQRNGFLRTFSFYDAPDSLIIYELTGDSRRSISNIGMNDIHDIDSGDQFHYITSAIYPGGRCTTESVRITLNESYQDGIIQFEFREVSKVTKYDDASGKTTVSNHDSTFIQTRVLYDFTNSILHELFNEMPGATSYLTASKDTIVIPKLRIDSTLYNGRIIKYYESPVYIQYDDSCYITSTDSCAYFYIDGCGGPYRKCEADGYREVDSLVYFKKGNKEWGTPLSDLLYGKGEMELSDLINVYPNPASEMINFRLHTNEYPNLRLEVYSSTGSIVASVPFVNNEIALNLELFKSGIFFFKVSNGVIYHMGKFIKE